MFSPLFNPIYSVLSPGLGQYTNWDIFYLTLVVQYIIEATLSLQQKLQKCQETLFSME